MLLEFSFKNFRSFPDETALDMTAMKMTEHEDSVVTVAGERVLPIAALFGANASGKSNVYSAFAYMSHMVLNSFQYGDDPQGYQAAYPEPFLFDAASAEEDSSFEVYFTLAGDEKEKTYNYGFSMNRDEITEEWLNVKARTAREYRKIFFRNHDRLAMPGLTEAGRTNISTSLNPQVLVVSLGSKLRVDKCKVVRDWFLQNELANFGDTLRTFMMSKVMPDHFAEDVSVQKRVLGYLNAFDDSIRAFRVEKVPQTKEDSREGYKIFTAHQLKGHDKYVWIPLEAESAGTLKMFGLYSRLEDVLAKGSVFFVDELNARLHPLLVRSFLQIFLNPNQNPNHAQLIFTTHDAWQLSSNLLRRDEIWFTEKNEEGESTLFSLADFVDEDGNKIRKDENFEKNYLWGKYGAIPQMKALVGGRT